MWKLNISLKEGSRCLELIKNNELRGTRLKVTYEFVNK